MNSPHLLVHHHDDSVGVAVVENIEADMDVTVWVMDNDGTLHFRTRDAIPLGHKMALVALNEGDTVYKYGHDVGRVVAPIQVGGHVHVHNVKTKRW